MTLDPGAGLSERLVTLPDGRSLRAVVAGLGSGPLVVFEAGMSAPAATWLHNQREVAARYRTLSYDRAGYGGSDDDPAERTLERIVADLAALLDAMSEQEPVVLVGHSWGGPILRLFAELYPHRVAGLVFVDASIAETMAPKNVRTIVRSLARMAFLARIGGARLIERATFHHGISPEITEADQAVMLRDYASVRAMRAGGREAEQIIAAAPTMRRLQATGTPDVPTVCLYGGRLDRGMRELRPLLNRTAAELMAASSQGRLIVVDAAGHMIPQESPAVVRDTIFDLLERIEG